MHYVYLLKSVKSGKSYIGQTDDLQKRFYQHNNGQNLSTKSDAPWELVAYEAYKSKALAMERERMLKRYGKGYSDWKKRAGFWLKDLKSGEESLGSVEQRQSLTATASDRRESATETTHPSPKKGGERWKEWGKSSQRAMVT